MDIKQESTSIIAKEAHARALELLEAALKQDKRWNKLSLSLSPVTQSDRFVLVNFSNGTVKYVNITDDSVASMMYDVLRYLLKH